MSKSKDDKIKQLKILVGILTATAIGFAIIIVGLSIKGFSTNLVDDYVYGNSNLQEQVEKTNKGSLEYFKYIEEDYDSVIVSNVGVQNTVYKLYDDADKEFDDMFIHFENGSVSWGISGKLFTSDCFHYIKADEFSTNNELMGLVDKYIGDSLSTYPDKLLSEDLKGYNFSLFAIPAELHSTVYNETIKQMEYNGKLYFKQNDSLTTYKIPFNNNRYSLYIANGDITKFNTSDFVNIDSKITFEEVNWCTSGSIDNLLYLYSADMQLKVLNTFSVIKSDYDSVDTVLSIEEYIDISSFPYYIIVDETMDLIVAIAKKG